MSCIEQSRHGDPITDDDAVGLLRRMLEIPSPSYKERELAEFLVDAMREPGSPAPIDDAGNVIGEIVPGDGPTVMLLSHMDTVPGDVPVRQGGARVPGRG